MSHIIKFWESDRANVRHKATISANQFGFMPRCSAETKSEMGMLRFIRGNTMKNGFEIRKFT